MPRFKLDSKHQIGDKSYGPGIAIVTDPYHVRQLMRVANVQPLPEPEVKEETSPDSGGVKPGDVKPAK